MRDTLRRICELQPRYSSTNTPEMQERGHLIRQVLVGELRSVQASLSTALGRFGHDLLIEGSDGIGRKTELAWVRLASKSMSPRPTDGFYIVLHFSTDGSGVNIAVGCSSSKFHNGYSIILPPEQLDKRCDWLRGVVLETRGTLEPFTDSNDFGAKAALPRSFQRACALVKKIDFDDIEDEVVVDHLLTAGEMLRVVYDAQEIGRELTPADQTELDILNLTRPTSRVARSQGFGLSSPERKAVELRAMAIAETWLREQGYAVKDTSATHPYDFVAKAGEEDFYVEVKGTTSDSAEAIAMTHNEVELHQTHKGRTALLIVTGIRLHRNGAAPTASDGTLESLMGWDIDAWSLSPTAFRVSRP
jgi:hypothetical protein